GSSSVGTITAAPANNAILNGLTAPAFTVSGTHTYGRAGFFPINVDIADFGGGPSAAGSNPMLGVNNTAQVAGPVLTSLGPSSVTAGSQAVALSVFGTNFVA